MDFSKLNQNEKLAVYGAAASVIGPILASMGFGFGVGFLTLLLALAMLAVVFMPQLSPSTALPGSKGSLMVIIGGIAAASAALALLGSIGWLGLFGSNVVFVLGWLLGIAGGLLMGWAGWQEFQAEGGKLRLGSSPTVDTSAAPADAAPPTTAGPAEHPEPDRAAPAQGPDMYAGEAAAPVVPAEEPRAGDEPPATGEPRPTT